MGQQNPAGAAVLVNGWAGSCRQILAFSCLPQSVPGLKMPPYMPKVWMLPGPF